MATAASLVAVNPTGFLLGDPLFVRKQIASGRLLSLSVYIMAASVGPSPVLLSRTNTPKMNN